MNEADLQKAMVRGTKTAVRRAFRWSGEMLWPGDTGAENLLQVSIAEAVYNQPAAHRPAIILEPTLNSIDSDAFPGDTRRVDIGLLRGTSSNYFSIIEVKKYPVGYMNDIRKICEIMDSISTVRYAYLVTYFQKYDADRNLKLALADQMTNFSREVERVVEDDFGRSCSSFEPQRISSIQDEAGHWHAAVIVTRFGAAA